MDLSFSRRSRRALLAGTPDLHALLSAAAARQALTPAARAHWSRSEAAADGDPRVALFAAGDDPRRVLGSSFANLPETALNRGQTS